MIIKIVNLLISIVLSFNLCIDKINNVKEDVISYVAYLNIPKINVSQPIYDINDNRSDIDENIIFVSGSDMPNVNKGNVIIAGHSGSATVSYFKDLYQLKVGDPIYLEYNNYIYEYVVDNRYIVNKTGTIEINRDNKVEALTLVTCYGKNKQLVVIANKVGQTKK